MTTRRKSPSVYAGARSGRPAFAWAGCYSGPASGASAARRMGLRAGSGSGVLSGRRVFVHAECNLSGSGSGGTGFNRALGKLVGFKSGRTVFERTCCVLPADSGLCVCDHVDVLLLVDVTGSMGPYITEVISAFSYVAARLSAGGSCRFGVAAFTDYGPNAFAPEVIYKVVTPFTYDIDTFVTGLSSLTVGGGGGLPEAHLDALVGVADVWDSTLGGDATFARKRAVFIISDAPSHVRGDDLEGAAPDEAYFSVSNTISILSARCIRVFGFDYAAMGSTDAIRDVVSATTGLGGTGGFYAGPAVANAQATADALCNAMSLVLGGCSGLSGGLGGRFCCNGREGGLPDHTYATWTMLVPGGFGCDLLDGVTIELTKFIPSTIPNNIGVGYYGGEVFTYGTIRMNAQIRLECFRPEYQGGLTNWSYQIIFATGSEAIAYNGRVAIDCESLTAEIDIDLSLLGFCPGPVPFKIILTP